VLTTGSSAGFMLTFLAMFEPGDRIAIESPSYPPYRNVLTALGCEPVPIEVTAATRFAIDPGTLRAVHRGQPLKGLLVASPANPTGTMMTADALAALVRAAEGEGIAVISDEIYHGLDYAFPAQTALNVSANAVVINSFSKYFCMTGWRIGWMVVPPELVRPIERLQQSYSHYVTAGRSHEAAVLFSASPEASIEFAQQGVLVLEEPGVKREHCDRIGEVALQGSAYKIQDGALPIAPFAEQTEDGGALFRVKSGDRSCQALAEGPAIELILFRLLDRVVEC